MDVTTLMRRAAHQFGPLDAIVCGDRRLTFSEAWGRGVRLANAFLAMGLEPGDRIAHLQNNSVEAADTLIASCIVNLVRVPLYARNARPSHIHMIRNTGCRVVVTSSELAHELAGLVDEIPCLESLFVADENYEAFLREQSEIDPEIECRGEDFHMIRHTGGTTGPSKGVTFSHESWLAIARDWWVSFPPVERGDRCLHVGPISHGSGYFFTPMWISGAANVLMGKFDPVQVIDLMQRERICFMFLVPAILRGMVDVPAAAEKDWSFIKMLCVGAAPIPEALIRRAFQTFGKVMYQAYGQTEVLPATVMGPNEWISTIEGSNPVRSAGRASPFAEVRIVDPETKAFLELGSEGEIAVLASGAMKFFWNDEASTAQRMLDKWVLTGDIGRIDENGYLYVLDRKQDMIISGGFNIYPAELENAILRHSGVLEVAAFPIPDEKWGETPGVVCVVKELNGVSEADIVKLCVEELGSYKKPGKVVITTEQLPRTPVGKIDKKSLREPFWASRDVRVSGG